MGNGFSTQRTNEFNFSYNDLKDKQSMNRAFKILLEDQFKYNAEYLQNPILQFLIYNLSSAEIFDLDDIIDGIGKEQGILYFSFNFDPKFTFIKEKKLELKKVFKGILNDTELLQTKKEAQHIIAYVGYSQHAHVMIMNKESKEILFFNPHLTPEDQKIDETIDEIISKIVDFYCKFDSTLEEAKDYKIRFLFGNQTLLGNCKMYALEFISLYIQQSYLREDFKLLQESVKKNISDESCFRFYYKTVFKMFLNENFYSKNKELMLDILKFYNVVFILNEEQTILKTKILAENKFDNDSLLFLLRKFFIQNRYVQETLQKILFISDFTQYDYDSCNDETVKKLRKIQEEKLQVPVYRDLIDFFQEENVHITINRKILTEELPEKYLEKGKYFFQFVISSQTFINELKINREYEYESTSMLRKIDKSFETNLFASKINSSSIGSKPQSINGKEKIFAQVYPYL